MKWILGLALVLAFSAPLAGATEAEVIEVARAAAEPRLAKTYAKWAKQHKTPARTEPWLKDLPPTTATKKGGYWVIVWLDEPPAGWFFEAKVSVNDKGKAKILKARAGFASAE